MFNTLDPVTIKVGNEIYTEKTIRNLLNKMNESEKLSHSRVTELRSVIDKLQLETKESSLVVTQLRQQLYDQQTYEAKNIDQEKSILHKENQELTQKILWYAENQVLIETVQEERSQLQALVNQMKRELIKLGYKRDALTKLLSGYNLLNTPYPSTASHSDNKMNHESTPTRPTRSLHNDQHSDYNIEQYSELYEENAMNKTFASGTPNTGKKAITRHPADVKRIK
jgi:hypothetical protein